MNANNTGTTACPDCGGTLVIRFMRGQELAITCADCCGVWSPTRSNPEWVHASITELMPLCPDCGDSSLHLRTRACAVTQPSGETDTIEEEINIVCHGLECESVFDEGDLARGEFWARVQWFHGRARDLAACDGQQERQGG